MEIILLPTCGYIYSVPICDVYLLIWTWLHRLISGGNYLNYEARIISLHLPVSKLSLSGVHQDTLMDHQTPKLSTSHLYLLQSSVHLQHTCFVSTPGSVDSLITWIHSPWYSAQSKGSYTILNSGSTSTVAPSTALKLCLNRVISFSKYHQRWSMGLG